MAVRPQKLTYVDYAAFPDDGLRREIIDGEVFVTPAANTRHQNIVGRIFVAMATHLSTRGGGQVFVAPYDVVLSDDNVVQPDIVFVETSRLNVITDANIRGIPTLVVEVVSDPRHDRVRKRDLYGSAGVPVYWIVDPDADRVEVYRLESTGTYGKPEILEPGDTMALDALPGLAIDIAVLLRR